MEGDLDSVLQDTEATQETEQVEQGAEDTGEQAAPPAESEADKRARGIEAALLAERRRRQEVELAYQQLVAGQQQRTQTTEPQQPSGRQKPNPADYQDRPEQYWEDLADWKAQVAVEAALSQRDKKQAERQALEEKRRAEEEQDRTAAAVISRGQAKYADFDAAINAGLAPYLSEPLRRAIFASDVAEDVSYWLAKNPAEADRISKFGPERMALELGVIQGRLSQPQRPAIPQTLSQARDERGQFAPVWTGPTPLDDILNRKT